MKQAQSYFCKSVGGKKNEDGTLENTGDKLNKNVHSVPLLILLMYSNYWTCTVTEYLNCT